MTDVIDNASNDDKDKTRTEPDRPQLNPAEEGSLGAVNTSSTNSRDQSDGAGQVLVTGSNLPASVFSE